MYTDPVLKGEYPAYCIDLLKQRGIIMEVTEEDSLLMKEACLLNGFLVINYYHPNAVEIDVSREASTG